MTREWNVFYRKTRWCGCRPRCFLPVGKQRYWLLTGIRRYAISTMPYRGQFIAEVWTKTWGHGRPPDRLLEVRRRPSVKKVKLSERSSVKHLAALESEVLRDHCALLEALAMLQYDDGSPRKPGYLGVWTNGSTWTVRITDSDADATLTADGRTIDEALQLLTLLLGADDAPWEPNARRKGKGR